MTLTVILGALGVGVSLWRGMIEYRRTGTIPWGWVLAAFVFLANALTPIV